MAVGKCGVIHDIEKMQHVVPIITCKTAFGENVRELVGGFDVLNLDFGVPIYSVKQPVESNSVGAGHVSHRRTSAFDNHFNHSFVVFKNVQP